ncbi:Restriction of telomere capping protein 5 [Candida viswanathii]|uniref:Restriction of telomere capping protein 5 n=1 Tax=Candida viswanathii TaxID=5486 RepID=A0A367YER6_9ASCO|nr:Restriction of telomere capping protein 5 [Candida viswanathii]
MGQTTSSPEHVERGEIMQEFTKEELQTLFYHRCELLLKPIELAFLKEDFKGRDSITAEELAKLLKFPDDDNPDLTQTTTALFQVMKTIGTFPFLKSNSNEKLLFEELVVSLIFFSGRYKKIFSRDYDFLKLFFLGLSNRQQSKESVANNEKKEVFEPPKFKASLIVALEEEDKLELKARKVNWSQLDIVKDYDGTNIEESLVNSKKLQNIVTLCLILNSIMRQNQDTIYKQFADNVGRWSEFEVYSLYMLRYADVYLTSDRLDQQDITYQMFNNGVHGLLPYFFQINLNRMVCDAVLSSNKFTQKVEEEEKVDSTETTVRKKHTFPKFQESKLVSIPFLSYVSSVLQGINNPTMLTTSNLVKLYAGSEAGFSIRSLETKIFKWQAPTLVVVSGKRVKAKTMQTNRRYQKFDEMYPRHFLALENHLRDWQNDNDRITYAVLVNQPWKNSNKNNFGDEKSLILSILPRADYFKSVHSNILKGELIYFNNLGMGLGFGNNQPLNKNETKRFIPGDVSLTIEANLEFAVFRHLVNLSSNNDKFFQNSQQSDVAQEDFEDRFTITSIEVWGLLVSGKELEEQRKQWEWEEKQAEARQNVNIRSMGEERAFLEMAGLVGNHGAAGGSM